MLSNAAYFPKTFFTSPILRWILPTAFSAVPRSRKSESPAASPVFSFTFPFASSIRPLILSLVLDFTREESALMRILDVDLGLERLFIFLFYFFPRWVDPGSARLKKGKKVPGAGFLPIAPPDFLGFEKISLTRQDNSPQARIGDSTSTNAVSFSSAPRTKRFRSPRCALARRSVRQIDDVQNAFRRSRQRIIVTVPTSFARIFYARARASRSIGAGKRGPVARKKDCLFRPRFRSLPTLARLVTQSGNSPSYKIGPAGVVSE